MAVLRLSALTVAVLGLGLSGCATFNKVLPAPAPAPAPQGPAAPVTGAAPGGAAAAGTAAAGAAGAAPSAAAAPQAAPSPSPAPAPGQPPAFASVIKDAKKTEGLFGVWRKDDKVWFELKPEDFGKPFFLSPKLTQGIGEAGLFGGTMFGRWGEFGRPQIVELRRVHNQVQLIARNDQFVGKGGTAAERAVAAGYSSSLLGSTTVASQPHPEHKTVLIEANPLFLSDLQGLAMGLQRTYRQNYAFDLRHSSITNVRATPEAVVIEARNHYATPVIAVPTPGAAAPGTPQPTTPGSLPDVRSLFFGLHYSIAKLPDEPMKPRRADPRVGYFTTNVQDFSDDLARTPRQRYVNRWRLEKKEPGAELSEPVKPITYWLDRTIPEKYRASVTEGILEWNKAFEKIGFKNAIVVKVQPADADFDTLDVGVASVRWMTNHRPIFGAIGPSQVDPRTGEILDADIGLESLSSRNLRAVRSQVLTAPTLRVNGIALTSGDSNDALAAVMQRAQHPEQCTHAMDAAEQLSYAMDVLEARGDLDPDSPEAEQFVQDYMKDVTMHEVGHTLGLRHNFRSSRIYSDKQLSDPDFTRKNGLAGSVMEYAPINLPRPGEKGGAAWQLALGPYDYWAIEYAYKQLAADKEESELQRVAARSAEPQLAYGTDEDNWLGVDPESLQFDLGDDVIGFAKKRIEIGRDLITRQDQRPLKSTQDYSVLRRSVSYAVRDVGRAATVLARQIGGVRTLRDFPGSGRDPLVPVAAGTQREALDVLARGLFAADSFRLSPALQRRLAPDYEERLEAAIETGGAVATDYSIATIVLDMQRQLLGYLMSDTVAARILDSEGKVGAKEAFRLSELYARLTREVWSDLAAKGDIPAMRRELQREYINRLAGTLVRPSSYSRADARSLLRLQARELLGSMSAASRRAELSTEARAHLQDAAETLREALAAKMQRQGV
jgi:Met-zincin/Domain of unknown function (DUF5117)/Domain of unknown function (DUF5118)